MSRFLPIQSGNIVQAGKALYYFLEAISPAATSAEEALKSTFRQGGVILFVESIPVTPEHRLSPAAMFTMGDLLCSLLECFQRTRFVLAFFGCCSLSNIGLYMVVVVDGSSGFAGVPLLCGWVCSRFGLLEPTWFGPVWFHCALLRLQSMGVCGHKIEDTSYSYINSYVCENIVFGFFPRVWSSGASIFPQGLCTFVSVMYCLACAPDGSLSLCPSVHDVYLLMSFVR